MTRILVTGGAGMIGSNLVRRLVAEGARVTVVDKRWRGRIENLRDGDGWVDELDTDFHKRDPSRPGQLDDLLGEVEHVFHLADVVAGIGYAFSNQLSLSRQNLLINTDVVESVARDRPDPRLRRCGHRLLLPPGASDRTGRAAPAGGGSPPASRESAYGWSELMGQLEAQLFEKEHGVPVSLPNGW